MERTIEVNRIHKMFLVIILTVQCSIWLFSKYDYYCRWSFDEDADMVVTLSRLDYHIL